MSPRTVLDSLPAPPAQDFFDTFRQVATNHSAAVFHAAPRSRQAPFWSPLTHRPANSSTGNYTVGWGAVGGATSYTLQEQLSGGGWFTIQANGSLSLALTGKHSGNYGYRVQACNGGGCGPWSPTGTITAGIIPATPAGPYVDVTGPSYKPVVHVSWAAVAEATTYTVEMFKPGSSAGVGFYSGPNTEASMLVLTNGEVKFRVKACNVIGCSGWSGFGSVEL